MIHITPAMQIHKEKHTHITYNANPPNFIGDESEGLLETRTRKTHGFGGSKALVMHVLCWMEEYPKVSGFYF